MPGFKINGSGDGPSNTLELAREHRWLINKLGNIDISKGQLLIAKEVNLPEYDIDIQEILGGLMWYKYAKAVKWKDVHIVFYDDGKIAQALEGWRNLVYTNDGGMGKHDGGNGSYKQDSKFSMLDGAGKAIYDITLKQSWPKQILYGKLSYTSSEIKAVDLVLCYDFAIVNEGEESPGISAAVPRTAPPGGPTVGSAIVEEEG